MKDSRRPTVTAAMIVRNEEEFLPGCLASLTGMVDEVVIVDAGSTDSTIGIANEAGARVLCHDWAGDFSIARNIALEAASSDWILYIDADERLSLPAPGMLGDWIDSCALAGFVRFSPRSGYTRYREWRLFRRDDRIRFAGSFHETVIPAIRRLSEQTGWPVVQTIVEIDHLGYDLPSHAKLTRNLNMLTALLSRDPSRIYCWYHLAETLMALNHPAAALDAARKGLDLVSDTSDDDQRAAASLIRHLVIRERFARNEPVAGAAAAALKLNPADHAMRLILAEAAVEEGSAVLALEPLIDLLSVDPEDLFTGRLAFDRRIFGENALLVAARTCSALGDRVGSARCVAFAARSGGSNPKSWVIERLGALRSSLITTRG